VTSSASVAAPAKINLMLHILGRRADGYHELQTVFQLLDLADQLHIQTNNSGSIRVDMAALDVPLEDNLVYRAACLLPRRPEQGATIAVEKRIPAGGGLGGGSSDAATALVVLNRLWQCGLSRQQLLQLGARLGADVPVFVGGHSAWAEGVGEQLTPMTLPPRWFLIVRPDVSVATGKIFADAELTRDTPASTMSAFFGGDHRNDCEAVVRKRYPEVDRVLRWLESRGPARLTGTGACAFLSADDEALVVEQAAQVPPEWQRWIARGINQSPLVVWLPEH
jgi:4-diphosphocytidyl-2-C-methyl-D-erythritol kinase